MSHSHRKPFPSKLQLACSIMLVVVFINLYFITSLSKCSEEEVEALQKQLDFYRAGMKAQATRVKELLEQVKILKQAASGRPQRGPVLWGRSGSKETVIFGITPTYARPEQKAELTRLSQTLLHVSNFHWIVIEDTDVKSELVTNFLKSCGLSYTHLNVRTPDSFKMKSSDPNWLKPRGVLQRNLGIKWLRENVDPSKHSGVVYFLDDDNTYHLSLFDEMRRTKKISVWPVGLVGALRYESPKVTRGKVTGWMTFWKPERPFAMDMAGFALNLQLLFDFPRAVFANEVQRGYQESTLLSSMNLTLDDLEPKADNCTKILVWHTRTEKTKLKNEDRMKQKFGHGTDPNMEV